MVKLTNSYTNPNHEIPLSITKFKRVKKAGTRQKYADELLASKSSSSKKKSNQPRTKLQKKSNVQNDLLDTMLKSYLADRVETKSYCLETIKKYHNSIDKLRQYMHRNRLKLETITKEDVSQFRNELKKSLSAKTVNNIINGISNVLSYNTMLLSINPFANVSLYDKYMLKSSKRNFTKDELVLLFDGKHGIEKEVLDALRFILFTGLRIGEFYSLEPSSFLHIDGHPWVKVRTEKLKGDNFRLIPIHPFVTDLVDFKSFKRLFAAHNSLTAINKKLNRCIDKVTKDPNVSVHRLRGTFVYIVDDYLQYIGFEEMHSSVKELCGHVDSKNSNEEVAKFKLTQRMAGYAQDITTSIYAKGQNEIAKLKAIRALDVLDGIFEYMNIKHHKKLKKRKYTRRKSNLNPKKGGKMNIAVSIGCSEKPSKTKALKSTTP